MDRPERTCVGCRRRSSKSELLRLVVKAAQVAVDPRQVEPGRGAYLHRDPECLDRALRRRGFGRALRSTNVDSGHLSEAVAPYVNSDRRPA